MVMVKVSPKQLSKLRNGHKIRVKRPEMEGEGVCLIVNPANYDTISRSFSRNKGSEVALSPSEVMVNKEAAATMSGQGIFGKKFDRFVKKTIGKKGAKILYGIAKEFLPVAQAGIDVASLAATPMLGPGAAILGARAKDYLANPKKYQEGKSDIGDLARGYIDTKTQDLQAQLQDKIATQRDRSLADLQARADKLRIANEQAALTDSRSAYERLLAGNGLYAGGSGLYVGGSGLYAGARSRGGAIVSGRNSLMGSLAPALQSQPYSANFQFRATLPPAYQRYTV